MEILILLLILLIIFPKILIFVILPLVIFVLLLLPALIITKSLVVFFQTPVTMLKIAFDKQLRRNHALEHATINVLEEYFPGKQFSGYSEKNGFKLIGWLPAPEVVYEAAQEGLQRLQKGEKKLAVHKRCGTTFLISNLLFASAILIILLGVGKFSFLTWVILIIGAMFIAKPLGILAQKYLTTQTDVQSIYIKDIEIDPPDKNPIKFFYAPNRYFIKTSYFKISQVG